MEQIKVKLKRWGNSLGVVIPQNVLESVRAGEGDELSLFIKKDKNDLLNLFGKLKGWKLDSQKFKDEIRKEESEKK